MSSIYNDQDMHHKVCKKMAQLTRVIYQMNTRNDENELIIENRISMYEGELSRVVKECNQIVSKYQSELENAKKNDRVKEELSKLQKGVNREKTQAEKEFLAL